MKIYLTKKSKIAGTSFKEVTKKARAVFDRVKARTKRRPYVRSKYFKKDKIFISIFWTHLFKKNEKDRLRRLRFLECALDLIINSNFDPVTRENFQKKDELLHRFYGSTTNKDKFVVQIKENKRTKRKDLISIYPE